MACVFANGRLGKAINKQKNGFLADFLDYICDSFKKIS